MTESANPWRVSAELCYARASSIRQTLHDQVNPTAEYVATWEARACEADHLGYTFEGMAPPKETSSHDTNK